MWHSYFILPCLKLPSCVPVCPTVCPSASQACLTASLSLHTHTHACTEREAERVASNCILLIHTHTCTIMGSIVLSLPVRAPKECERANVCALLNNACVSLSLCVCVMWGQHRMWQRRNVKPKKQQQVECVVFGMTNSLTKFALQRNQMEVTTKRSTRMCVHAVA